MGKTYERTCIGCKNEFVTTRSRQTRCVKDCGRNTHHAARRKQAYEDLQFVAVDGEGVDRPDGNHEYVMLSVGSETLWNNGRALELDAILSFLWDRYCESPNAAFVGFYLGYDFIQWEKLLPESHAWLLLASAGIAERKSQRSSNPNPYPDAVVWERWEIDVMANRRFKLRPHVCHQSEYSGRCRNRTCGKEIGHAFDFGSNEPNNLVFGEMEFDPDQSNIVDSFESDYWLSCLSHSVGKTRKAKAYGWMYVCDTGPFWQTSFLNVINPKGWDHPVCTQEEYERVKQGKDKRGEIAEYGATDYFEEMRQYNILENDILARVTERLNHGFNNDTIPISLSKNEWYGPGRAAQLWMDQLHGKIAEASAREHNKRSTDRKNEYGILSRDVYDSVPSWAIDAARATYYGGWFEQFCHGHVGRVYEYDINSAYPFIIADLPCLHSTGGHNGTWRRGSGNSHPDTGYVLLKCTIRGSNPYIGTMPHRTFRGSILRPHVTEGWYWLHEIMASQAAGLVDTVDVSEWVSYLPCDCAPPFNPPDIGIQRMYQMRLDVGKNSPQGKSAKLVYNSAYGKTAQSVGAPKYSNPIYASLITAGCRTLILDAISTHPIGAGAVTMVATDGVYFRTPHPTLNLSPTKLGAWDQTVKENLTQLMPGVYWDDSTREAIRNAKSPKLKSRGISARDLARQINHLDNLFFEFGDAVQSGTEYVWPEMKFEVAFTMQSAKQALQRKKWNLAGSIEHGKERSISSNPHSKRDAIPYWDDADDGIVRTRPYGTGPTISTTDYDKSFGYLESDGGVDRDGRDPLSFIKDIINA